MKKTILATTLLALFVLPAHGRQEFQSGSGDPTIGADNDIQLSNGSGGHKEGPQLSSLLTKTEMDTFLKWEALLADLTGTAGASTSLRGDGSWTARTSADTSYDNTLSGLAATNAKTAIDELAAEKADTDTLAITLIGGVGGVADVKDPNDSNGNRVYDDPIICASVDADCSYLSTTTGWWLAMSSNGVTATVWRSVTPRGDLGFAWVEEWGSALQSGALLHADNTWNFVVSDTSAQIDQPQITGAGPGAVRLFTTTSGTVGNATVWQGSASTSPSVSNIVLTAGMVYEALLGNVSSCDATDDCQLVFGLCNDVLPAGGYVCTNGVWFEYNRATSANWLTGTASTLTGSTTLAPTSVVRTADQRFRWVASASTPALGGTADTVTFYIDDVQVAQHTTNIPDANVARVSRIMMGIRKIAGTASRNVVFKHISLSSYPRHQ